MAQNFLSQIYANHGIRIDDALQDGTGLPGTAGQILSSNATGVSWIDPSALPAGAAETVEIQVKNTSGGILTKGTPVYIKPSTSAIDRVEVAAADAGDSTKMPAVGLLAQDLNNQATGAAITGGMLTNFTTDPIDGSTPTSNDTVYVKVGGGLTLTKPTGATGLIQNIAKVGKVSGGNSGSLVVSSILRTNDVPNLPTGRIWVGDGNSIASTVVFIDETNGFFGINNATPTAQLDVTGKVNFEDLKLDGELLDQFNSPGANGMILQSLKLGPTNPQGINWVSAGQIVVTGIQENNNTAFIDVTAAGLGAGYVTGPVTISAELSAGGTPTSANFLRGDNTWATAVTGLTVGNSNFIDLSNVGTATVPDITATLSASGTPLATNFLSGDNTWKQIEIASGNTNTLTVAFTNKNVLTVQTPGVGAATFGLATGKQIYDYIAGLTVDDLSPPTADFDVNNNKILNLTTPTLADDAANKAYVDNVLAGSGALIYQGGYSASTNTPVLDNRGTQIAVTQGWTYTVTVDGTFYGETVKVGDVLIAETDLATGTGALTDWTTVQSNIDVATAGTSVTSVKGIAGFNEDDFTAVNGFVSVKDDTYVPYTGATTDVDLGANNLIVDTNTLYVNSSTNNVGIGTASPNAKLKIEGSGFTNGLSIKSAGNSGTYPFMVTYASGTEGDAFCINDSLNVGIGTASPSTKLTITESGTSTGSTLSLIGTNTGGSASQVSQISSYQPSGGGAQDAALDFKVRSNVDPFASPSTIMTLLGSGNVGIGTDSPSSKLEISGATGSYDSGIGFNATGTGARVYRTFIDTSGTFRFDDVSAGFLTRLAIDTSGNVGIGTDSPALNASFDRVLHIHSPLGSLVKLTDNSTGSGILNGTDLLQYGFDFYIVNRENGDIRISTNGTERMRIDSSGNVGIANSNPNGNTVGDGGKNLVVGNALTSNHSSAISIISGESGYSYLLFGDGDGAAGYRGQVRHSNSDESLQFVAAGSERMRIDSSGSVGIGTNNPSAYGKFAVRGAGNLLSLDATSGRVYQAFKENGTNRFFLGTLGGSDGLAFIDADGSAERMRIDSNGNVGIGKTPASGYKLDIEANNQRSRLLGTTGWVAAEVQNNGGTFTIGKENSSGGAFFPTTGAYDSVLVSQGAVNMVFGTNSAERMRITSGGDVLITGGYTSSQTFQSTGSLRVSSNSTAASGNVALELMNDATGTRYLASFTNLNGIVGSISTLGTTTNYATSSDYRLKENVVEMTGALDRVDALKPSRFNFIADAEKTVDGFLAHEVAEVVPEAITGEKDAVEDYEVTPAVLDDEGNVIEEAVMGTRPVYQGIDQSKIVPLLVGAIQELKAEIETLKSQINN